MKIHPTAVVHPAAELGKDVEIGPYCVVGEHVRVGDGTRLLSHVVVSGHTELGERNELHPFATVGVAPQDLKYRGEPTRLVVGSENVLREYVNVSTGTAGGGGVTSIGDHNLLMAYCHIAHDSRVGSHVIFANAAALAGHVTIEDHATVGAYTGIHQFCRVGRHAFVGAYSALTKDALPYFKTVGNRARVFGVNVIGLERRGFAPETVERIHEAYRILFQSSLNTTQAVERLKAELAGHEEIDVLLDFIATSTRGVSKR